MSTIYMMHDRMWCMDPFPNHLLRTEVLPPVVVTRSPKLDIACPRTISKYRDTSAPRKRSLCPKSLQLVPSWCLILPLADLSNPGGHPAPPPICQARPDLVNTGRTLFGKLPTRHQQGDLNYFAPVPGTVQ